MPVAGPEGLVSTPPMLSGFVNQLHAARRNADASKPRTSIALISVRKFRLTLWSFGKSGGMIVHGIHSLFIAGFIAAAAPFVTPAASAQLPVISFEDGVAVTPASADLFYAAQAGGLTGRAAKTGFDPLISETSRALHGDPLLVYEFIRENIETTAHFGLQKGGLGALLDRAGTAFDQAELMVDIVRAGGGSARYVYGDITLSAAQLREAFGLTTSVDPLQYLVNGGIPVSPSGNGATFTHVWVEVEIGGQWIVFDPALKTHTWHAGQDIAALAGISPVLLANDLLDGSTSGSSGTAAWLQGVSSAGAADSLDEYANALLNQFQSNTGLSGVPLVEVVGGRELIASPLVDDGLLVHPFQSVVRERWNGDIPDALRTRLDIYLPNLGTTVFASLFVDEYYGQRITLIETALNGNAVDCTGCSAGDMVPTQFETRLYAGHTALSQIDYIADSAIGLDHETYLVAETSGRYGDDVQLVLDAPYAADGGSYMDMQRDVLAYSTSQTEIFVVAGALTRHHAEQYESMARTELFRTYYENYNVIEHYDYQNGDLVVTGETADPEQVYWQNPSMQGGEISLDRDFYWRRWASQREHIGRLIAGMADVDIGHHFSLGISTGGGDVNNPPLGHSSFEDIRTPAWIDVTSNASIIGMGTGARLDEAVAAYTTFSSLLESSVIEMAFARTDHTEWVSRGISGLLAGSQRYYSFPAGQFDGTILSTSYTTDAEAIMQAYSNAGYQVIVGQSPEGGSKAHFHVLAQGSASGSAFLIYRNDTGLSQHNALRKGGASDVPGTVRPPEISSPDFVRGNPSAPPNLGYAVSPLTGALSYSPPPDIVAGPVGTPMSLAFQRQYASTAGYGAMGYGWSHNWDIQARLHNGSSYLTTSENPIHLAPTIAAVEMMLIASEQVSAIESVLVLSQIATVWMDQHMFGTLVTVNAGSDQGLFIRLADGSYRSLGNDLSSLTRIADGGDYVGGPDSFDLVYETPAGNRLRFEAVTASQFGGFASRNNTFLDDVFPATSWESASGIDIHFDYRANTGTLKRVRNNLGWQIEFASEENVCNSYDDWQPFETNGSPNSERALAQACREIQRRFRLITEARAGHSSTPSVGEVAQFVYDGSQLDDVYGAPYTVVLSTAQTPASGAGVFRYEYDTGEADGHQTTGYMAPVLSRVFTPGSTELAQFRVEFRRARGRLPDRVAETLHRTASADRGYDHYIGGARGEVVDPLGYATSTYYDEEGHLTRSISARGVRTDNLYDGLGRLIERRISYASSPSAYESRTTFTYDIHDNLLSEAVHPGAGRSGSALITLYAYDDLNWPHLPTAVEDPEGNRTVTEYDPVTGLIERQEGPSGEVVTFEYNSFGQVTEQRVQVSQ